MNIAMLLEMAGEAAGDRVALGSRVAPTKYADLCELSRRAAAWITARDVRHVVLLDVNSEALPVLLFGSAIAGLPFVPLNYRLSDDQLRALLARLDSAVVVV